MKIAGRTIGKVHCVGIGGIGMSALAQYFKDHGVVVTGSDRERSPVTELLERKGVRVAVPQRPENVPDDADALVYSDAVPENNPERARAADLGIPQDSYFSMLGKVSAPLRTVAIAGTHGKTTTTGMLAKILKDAGAAPTAIIGSIVKDFGSNYVPGNSDLFIVEACEYRDHLLELSPRVLVINNLEWDHTDFFPSLAALQETFRKAIVRVPGDGAIVTNLSDKNIAPLLAFARAPVIDYTKEKVSELRLPGEFNRANAGAAAAAARVILPSITDAAIAQSLAAFLGTWRRFEYKGKTRGGADVYDDYAHHPTAIAGTLSALRARTAGKVFIAFHPHLYSRTRDLFEAFSQSFKDADKVFLAPIYAAREEDDGSVSSEMLAERIRANGTDAAAFDSFDAILNALGDAKPGDAIMTMGAGDIYKLADRLVASQ
ncbi:MAG: UDP-N-acetylmuramate--L-alanine ligase [Minisyncoccota bacterium]